MYKQPNDERRINPVHSHFAAIFNMLYLIIRSIGLIWPEKLSITIDYNFTNTQTYEIFLPSGSFGSCGTEI